VWVDWWVNVGVVSRRVFGEHRQGGGVMSVEEEEEEEEEERKAL